MARAKHPAVQAARARARAASSPSPPPPPVPDGEFMTDPEYIDKLEELIDRKEEKVDRLRTQITSIIARGRLVVRSLKSLVTAARKDARDSQMREVCIL
jgi:hypothetical protein